MNHHNPNKLPQINLIGYFKLNYFGKPHRLATKFNNYGKPARLATKFNNFGKPYVLATKFVYNKI